MATVRHSTRALRSSTILVIALVMLAICANAGIDPGVRTATAASTDSVVTTATVGSALAVADTCSAAFDIAVVLTSYANDTCGIQFGSTNDATTTLRIDSSAGAFLSGAFTDHIGGCAALTGDTVGIKVSSVGAGVTSGLGCTVSAAGTNADLIAIPDAPGSACAATVMILTNDCTLVIGINESGGDAPAGNYTGTLDLDVIG